jgi:hypothetical protein
MSALQRHPVEFLDSTRTPSCAKQLASRAAPVPSHDVVDRVGGVQSGGVAREPVEVSGTALTSAQLDREERATGLDQRASLRPLSVG